jgi:hypothetical protein
MLADAAQVAGGKLYVLGGGWSVLYAAAPFAIALKIEVPWSVGDDTHTLRLELLDEDGQVVLGGEDKPLILIESTFRTGIAAGIKPGTPIDAVAAFPIPPLPLQTGRYEWRLTIDGQGDEDWHLGFTRADPPQAAGT